IASLSLHSSMLFSYIVLSPEFLGTSPWKNIHIPACNRGCRRYKMSIALIAGSRQGKTLYMALQHTTFNEIIRQQAGGTNFIYLGSPGYLTHIGSAYTELVSGKLPQRVPSNFLHQISVRLGYHKDLYGIRLLRKLKDYFKGWFNRDPGKDYVRVDLRLYDPAGALLSQITNPSGNMSQARIDDFIQQVCNNNQYIRDLFESRGFICLANARLVAQLYDEKIFDFCNPSQTSLSSDRKVDFARGELTNEDTKQATLIRTIVGHRSRTMSGNEIQPIYFICIVNQFDWIESPPVGKSVLSKVEEVVGVARNNPEFGKRFVATYFPTIYSHLASRVLDRVPVGTHPEGKSNIFIIWLNTKIGDPNTRRLDPLFKKKVLQLDYSYDEYGNILHYIRDIAPHMGMLDTERLAGLLGGRGRGPTP
ncbi:MAG: hypothetical protein N3F63_08180, partial [Thermoplasmata archaeon]|nr:hypothetical protein [Thermoplasmata archaeon]